MKQEKSLRLFFLSVPSIQPRRGCWASMRLLLFSLDGREDTQETRLFITSPWLWVDSIKCQPRYHLNSFLLLSRVEQNKPTLAVWSKVCNGRWLLHCWIFLTTHQVKNFIWFSKFAKKCFWGKNVQKMPVKFKTYLYFFSQCFIGLAPGVNIMGQSWSYVST